MMIMCEVCMYECMYLRCTYSLYIYIAHSCAWSPVNLLYFSNTSVKACPGIHISYIHISWLKLPI